MDFNALVLHRLQPLFTKHGLVISSQQENEITFQSEQVVIRIVHNALENSNAIYAAKDAVFLYPIDEKLIAAIFGIAVKIDFVTPEIFVEHLAAFFQEQGESLLQGNKMILKAIEEYVYTNSKRYTDELVHTQNLSAADQAWQAGDYSTFIRCLDQTNKANLPPSYALKYKMALDKINGK